jgi:uncharacterized membrane protein YidH (DUF202 family)
MAPDDPTVDEREASLFRERTDLAWNRSGLAVVVAAAVLLRRLWPLQGTRQVVAVICISIGATCWALAVVWGRHSAQRAGALRQPLSERRARAMTASTLAFAAGAFAFGFFPPT